MSWAWWILRKEQEKKVGINYVKVLLFRHFLCPSENLLFQSKCSVDFSDGTDRCLRAYWEIVASVIHMGAKLKDPRVNTLRNVQQNDKYDFITRNRIKKVNTKELGVRYSPARVKESRILSGYGKKWMNNLQHTLLSV